MARSFWPSAECAASPQAERNTIFERAAAWAFPALLVFLLLRVALDAWWIAKFRHGYPLNVDEIGYLMISFGNTRALHDGGIAGLLWNAFPANQSQNAPLVPLVTVPIQVLFGADIFPSFFVQAPFLVLLGLATFGLVSKLSNPVLGLLGAIVVTTIPDLTDYGRSYFFSVPSAALFTAAACALVKSEGLTRRGWSLAWGVLLGLSTLTRAMMIALVPGQVLAATLAAALAATARSTRLLNLVFGSVLALLTAGVWYANSWPSVFDYLIGTGYGSRSTYYGISHSLFSWGYWSARLTNFVNGGFYLALGALVGVTLLIGTTLFLLSASRLARTGKWKCLPQNDVFIVFVIAVSGYLALSSSANQGVGFTHPILPLLVALCMATIARLRWHVLRVALASLFLLVSAFNLLMKADVAAAFSGTRMVQVPGFGTLIAVEGRGDVQRALSFDGNEVGPPTSPMPERQKQWMTLATDTMRFMRDFAAAHQQKPVIVFGASNAFFHTSLLRIAAWLNLGMSVDIGQLSAGVSGDSVAAYRAQIMEKRPNFVITVDRSPWEFPPHITREFMDEAIRSLGFTALASYRLPDGLETTVWWLDRAQGAAANEK